MTFTQKPKQKFEMQGWIHGKRLAFTDTIMEKYSAHGQVDPGRQILIKWISFISIIALLKWRELQKSEVRGTSPSVKTMGKYLVAHVGGLECPPIAFVQAQTLHFFFKSHRSSRISNLSISFTIMLAIFSQIWLPCATNFPVISVAWLIRQVFGLDNHGGPFHQNSLSLIRHDLLSLQGSRRKERASRLCARWFPTLFATN